MNWLNRTTLVLLMLFQSNSLKIIIIKKRSLVTGLVFGYDFFISFGARWCGVVWWHLHLETSSSLHFQTYIQCTSIDREVTVARIFFYVFFIFDYKKQNRYTEIELFDMQNMFIIS